MTITKTIGDVVNELKAMKQTQKVVNAIQKYEQYDQNQEVFNIEATEQFLSTLR